MTLRRIAHVLANFPQLLETFIANELAELRRRGVEVRVLSLLPPRSELHHKIIASEGLDKIVYYNPADFRAVVKDFRPQLLHAHFATEATAAAIELAIEQEIPFSFTVHGYDPH